MTRIRNRASLSHTSVRISQRIQIRYQLNKTKTVKNVNYVEQLEKVSGHFQFSRKVEQIHKYLPSVVEEHLNAKLYYQVSSIEQGPCFLVSTT